MHEFMHAGVCVYINVHGVWVFVYVIYVLMCMHVCGDVYVCIVYIYV